MEPHTVDIAKNPQQMQNDADPSSRAAIVGYYSGKPTCSNYQESEVAAASSKLKYESEIAASKLKYEEKYWNYSQELYMINFYRERPFLWHPKDTSFHATNFKRKALKSLSAKLSTMGEPRSVELIIKRFKNLRTVFLRECRRIILEREIAEFPNLSRWQYFKPLFFLLDATKDENLKKFKYEFDAIERLVSSPPTLSPPVIVKEEYLEPRRNENQDSILPDLTPCDAHRQHDVETCSDPGVQSSVAEPVTLYEVRGGAAFPAADRCCQPRTDAVPSSAFLDDSTASSGVWEPSPSSLLSSSRSARLSTKAACRPAVVAPSQQASRSPAKRCDKGVMTEIGSQPSLNSDVEAELFGRQVTLHLQKMAPYNREMSKLLMQQVMSHFSLIQHDCQPPPPAGASCLGVGRSDFSQLFQTQLNQFTP